MRKKRVITKVMAMLLSFAVVFSMMPGVVFADEDNITVTFSYAKSNEIMYGPVSITGVHAGLAAEYGIGEASSSPTVLDAVVAAHKQKYGDSFTKDSAEEFVDSSLTKAFGNSGYNGHIRNGHYSSDYASGATVSNGDTVDVFTYDSDSYYGDYYAAFYQNDEICRELLVTAGESITLKVKGFYIMGSYTEENWEALNDLKIGTVNDKMEFTELAATDADGEVTIDFDKKGEYTLVSKGKSGTKPIVPAWCKVKVAEGLSAEEQQKYVAEDKEALSVNYDGSSNKIALPAAGKSGQTKISWTSDMPDVVTEKGNVIKPLEVKQVTLTASISCGEASDTKVFVVTVKAMNTSDIEERLASAAGALTSSALQPVQFSGGSGGMYSYESEVADSNILNKAQQIVNTAAPGATVTLNEVKSGAEYITADGTITYPEGYIKGNADVSFGLRLGEQKKTVDVYGIIIPTKDESKAEAVKALMSETTPEKILNGQEQNAVKNTLRLPVGSSYGLAIKWTSDDPAITIERGTSSSTGQLHKINRPAYGQEDRHVKLIAEYDYSDMAKTYGLCDGGPMPEDNIQTFSVVVPAFTLEEKQAAEALVKEAVQSVNAEGITAYDADGKDTKEAADLDNIIYDLHLYDFDRNNEYYKTGIKLSWSSTNPAIMVNYLRAKVTRPAGSEAASGDLVLTASKDGVTASKSFAVKVLPTGSVPEESEKLGEAIEKISSAYAAKDSSWWSNSSTADWWHASAIGAYEKLYGKEKLNSAQKQGFADQTINTIAEYINKIGTEEAGEATASNRIANGINGLSAFGFDSKKITTVNSTSVNADELLKKINVDGAAKGYFTTIAPYVLIALEQGNCTDNNIKDKLIDYILSQQLSEGKWGYGTTFDAGTTAMIIQGLAGSDRSDVKQICVTGIKNLADAFNKCSGSTYGDANTDAMVIIALTSMGIDSSSDGRFVKNNVSLTEGLMSYLNSDNTAFRYNGEDNDYATKQGLLALLAAKQIRGKTSSVNIFDFSDIEKEPVKAKSSGTVTPVNPPTGGEDIDVTVSIKAKDTYWLTNKRVTVKEGATVAHTIITAIEGTDIRQTGAENGYISSVSKGAVTLSEFSYGSNSGWLYKVNNILPSVSVTSKTVSDNDNILLYYTTDWTKDPDAGSMAGIDQNKSQVTTSGTDTKTTTVPAEVKVSGNIATAAVTDENAKELVKQAKENKSAEIIINVSATDTKDAETVKLELDKKTVESIVKDTEATVTVKTPAGEINLDKETLKQIAGEAEGNKISIEITKVSKPEEAQKSLVGANGQIFKLAVKSGNKVISKFKGTVTVRLAVPTALKDKNIAAVHIEGSVLEKLEGRRITQNKVEFYEFKTPHFSEFALVDTAVVKLDSDDKNDSADKAKSLIKELKLKAVSSKTAKKNVKVTVKMNSKNNTLIKELSDMGYTVKYRYYRSVKKASKYTAVKTKTSKTYINTKGKRGSKYYYKVRAVVYDGDKVIAQSALKQCKYAVRTWSK